MKRSWIYPSRTKIPSALACPKNVIIFKRAAQPHIRVSRDNIANPFDQVHTLLTK